MTPSQINTAIAKACGWQEIHTMSGRTPEEDTLWGKRFIERFQELSRELPLPDYCHDLNHMAEAERTIKHEQKAAYSEYLYRVNKHAIISVSYEGEHDFEGYFDLLHSTAAQRAESFLKTLSLWEA